MDEKIENKIEYEDYWNELDALQKEAKNLDDFLEQESRQFREEGDDEADWLKDVGLDHLTAPYRQGREIPDLQVDASVAHLSTHQAEAVKRRVRTLNQTVRNRYRQQRHRHRKPDIRDVFKDLETSSTGTRSRSATPDSLDSEEEAVSCRDATPVQRPAAKCPAPSDQPVLPGHELFARAGHQWSVRRVDVASNTEGIELLGYQRFGTIHGPPRRAVRSRSGSVPTVTVSALDLQTTTTLPNDVPTVGESPMSFESSFFETKRPLEAERRVPRESGADDVLHISDAESLALRPLLWLELSAVFDKHSVTVNKRPPYKRKRKENGNVFGVSLSSLVMRDRRICLDNSTVPQVFQMILRQLESRCCKEEGILRIAGQKQRVENLYTHLENDFYTKPNDIQESLERSTCHELTSILKRLLRELPQPLLTTELLDLFYDVHRLPDRETRSQAMNLLVLLLPVEHSGTLRTLVFFLRAVVENESCNKMSLHNVAMIVAPSLFPPMQLQLGKEATDISGQIKIAAHCCHLVETMLQTGPDLWKVPVGLKAQLRTVKKIHKGRKELHRSNTHHEPSGSSRAVKDFRLA